MPVSGLVVSLVEASELRQEAIGEIRQESRIEIGVIQSQRMSVVIDTTSSDEDKELWHWLTNLPGVVFVDVVMVGFEGTETTGTETPEIEPLGAESKHQFVDSKNFT